MNTSCLKATQGKPRFCLTLLQCREIRAKGNCMKRPCLGAILLGLIPFVAVCFSVSLWDRVDPMVLGLPFNFFWLISWLLLTPLCMWGAYWLEERRGVETRGREGRAD